MGYRKRTRVCEKREDDVRRTSSPNRFPSQENNAEDEGYDEFVRVLEKEIPRNAKKRRVARKTSFISGNEAESPYYVEPRYNMVFDKTFNLEEFEAQADAEAENRFEAMEDDLLNKARANLNFALWLFFPCNPVPPVVPWNPVTVHVNSAEVIDVDAYC